MTHSINYLVVLGNDGMSAMGLGWTWLDFVGRDGTWWDLVGLLGTSWDFLGLLGTSWDVWDIVELRKIWTILQPTGRQHVQEVNFIFYRATVDT